MGRPAKDYTGQKINSWTVLQRVGSKVIHNKVQPMWLCECKCGTIRELAACQLRLNPLDCGCNGKPWLLDNIAGEEFNYLTALEYLSDKQKWECRCRCGKIVYATTTQLKTGRKTSCGCLTSERRRHAKLIDETENQYGELVVLHHVGVRGGEFYWRCRCSCGRTTEVRGSHLRNDSVRSCGCRAVEWQIEKKTIHGMSGTSEYALYQKRKRNALEKQSGEWDFIKEQFLRNIFQQCVVCGITEQEHVERYGQRLHIDHIKPLSEGNGLSVENATILCNSCNTKKHAKHLEDLPAPMRDNILHSSALFQLLWDGTQNDFCTL